MKKRIIFLSLSIILMFSSLFAETSEPEGDEKIRETIERIEEEEEKVKEGEYKEEEEEEKEEEELEVEEDSSLADLILEMLFKMILKYAFSIRFADYPYSKEYGFYFNTSRFISPEEKDIFSFQFSSDYAYHFDLTSSIINKFNVQVSAVHMNLFNQFVFSKSESFSILSFNVGLTFFLPNFMINGFIGFFYLNLLDELLPSFGFSSRLFLPAKFYIDIYNLYSYYYSLDFKHLSLGINYAISRFNIGLGYNYNNYADYIYSGPFIKASFWF